MVWLRLACSYPCRQNEIDFPYSFTVNYNNNDQLIGLFSYPPSIPSKNLRVYH